MAHDFFFPLLAAVFALASWGLVILARHLNEKNRMRAREILHKERMLAMQNNVSLPEGSLETSDLVQDRSTMSPAQALAWFRIVALCIGFFLLFGGIGMNFAFGVAEDFASMWSIGWIPTMAGLGLLVFYRLSRDLASQFSGE